nr:Hypothetical protein CBG15224 [Haemonchus contortus]
MAAQQSAPPTYQDALKAPSAPPPSQPSPQVNVPPPQQPQPIPMQGGVVYTVQPQTIIVPPTVIVIKDADTFHPYPEFCPKCQQIVITRRVWVSGSCACFVLIIACFVPFLWPLLFFLCTPRFKDAHHHCPCCMTLLSIKRR